MFTVTVTPDGGDAYDVTATSRDVMAWEKGGKGRSLGRLAENASITDVVALAYLAAYRQGRFSGTREEFEATCDVELQAPDEEAGPTRRGR